MTGSKRSSADLDPRRRRLLYRAWHRGTREMDLLIGSFCDATIDRLDETELAEIERLIELPDPTLYSWIANPSEAPEDYKTPLFDELCRSRHHIAERP
jgi:antitoxin CptB